MRVIGRGGRQGPWVMMGCWRGKGSGNEVGAGLCAEGGGCG